MINLDKIEKNIYDNIGIAKENGIILPTFSEMENPSTIDEGIKEKLTNVGLWDINPLNLFRINWHNEPKEYGGEFSDVNYIEFPTELTGVKTRIVSIVGKWFPTGCHKVGASYSCLVPRLVTGQFNAKYHKAVWPSTGNYCRGGAFNSKLLSCYSIAILPQEMSKERVNWLKTVASEIIQTPGCESNVKEIFDKVNELKTTRDDVVIFNQFEELGNNMWHYKVTGSAIWELFEKIKRKDDNLVAVSFTSGSSGTLGAGDYLKQKLPGMKVIVGEALQCPTLSINGFGGHRIEGIGDKHVPWIHNARNTDVVIDIDDEDSQRVLRLFNTEQGKNILKQHNIDEEVVENLNLLGISGIANLISCIKYAKYQELDSNDIIITVLTDSAEMYNSRIEEFDELEGDYTEKQAEADLIRHIQSLKSDNVYELSYYDKKRIHNLKYYTWIEQQGRQLEELQSQWYDKNYWLNTYKQVDEIDNLIKDFNKKVKA